MKSAIKDLKLKTDLNYNAKSFLIQTHDAKEILDHIRRIENLNAVYEVLIDKANISVNCNECIFIEDCIFKGEDVKDCRVKMLNRTDTLGISLL